MIEPAPPDAGARVRGAVGVIAWIALALAVVGAVLGVTAPGERTTSRLGIALALVGIALVESLACLWHGVHHAHEHGRNAALAALLVALAAGSVMALPVLIRAG